MKQMFLSLFVLLAVPALTRGAEVKTLSLSMAEETALKLNPHLLAARAEAEAAGTRPLRALVPYNPMIMVGYSGQDHSPLNLDAATGLSLMWEQRWDFPGKAIVEAGGERASLRNARAAEQLARRLALLHARRAYWDYEYNHAIHQLRQEARSQWKAFEDLLKSRGLAGQWLSVSRVKSQMGMARATNGFITAGQNLEVARAHLNHQLGLPAGTGYELDKPALPPDFKRDMEEEMRLAQAHSPQLEMARAMADRADLDSLGAAMDFLPDFTTRLQASGPRNGERLDYSARVGIQVPVGLRQGPAWKEKRLKAQAAGYRLDAARADLHHRVEEAFVTARAAGRLLELYRSGGLLKQSDEAWAFARGAWENERMSIDEYIQAYDAWQDIQVAWHKARTDYGKALAQLDFETGRLPEGGSHD